MPEPGRDETVRVVALDKNFHMKCYKCEVSSSMWRGPSRGRGVLCSCSRGTVPSHPSFFAGLWEAPVH